MEIVEAKTFANEQGDIVTAYIPVDPETYELKTDGEIAFNGEVVVGTQMGPMKFSFEFPEGFNLEKCFESFDQVAEEALDEKRKEMEDKNRIITPDQLNGGEHNPILMP